MVMMDPTVDGMLGTFPANQLSMRCFQVCVVSHRYAHCRCRCHGPAYGPCCIACPSRREMDAIRGQAAKVCRLSVCLPVLPCGSARVGGLFPKRWRDACDTRHLLNAEVVKATAKTSTSKSKSTESVRSITTFPFLAGLFLSNLPNPVDAALLHTSALSPPP